MRILIHGINYSPDLTGIGKYSGEMGSWLAKNGHEVKVITAMPYYPYWKIDQNYKGKLWHKEILDGATVYRCPLYIPSTPSGLKRLIQEVSFFFSSFFVVFGFLFNKKFDLFISVAPPFHLGLLALFYRFFKGTRIVYHVQDLQIDAAKELKILKPTFIFSILFSLERFILKRVDVVSTISEGMKRKIIIKNERK